MMKDLVDAKLVELDGIVTFLIQNDDNYVLMMLLTIGSQLNTLNCQLGVGIENINGVPVSDEVKTRLTNCLSSLRTVEEEVEWIYNELEKIDDSEV
jgi:hypothetical protein